MKIFVNNYIPLFSNVIYNNEINVTSLLNTKFIFIIVFIITILFDLFSSNIFSKEKNSIYLEKKFEPIDVAFNKSKNFLKNCISDDLFKFQSAYNFEQLKVSVVIPMHNCENFILRAVKSVQYQNLTNIEIILIDDNSTYNTLSMVTNIRNEDKRINIIKNKNNMGVLYTRSIGVLSSKGKFIFTLDNDDLFLNYDIFDAVTTIGEDGKFDIVEFKGISNKYFENDILIPKSMNCLMIHSLNIKIREPFINLN